MKFWEVWAYAQGNLITQHEHGQLSHLRSRFGYAPRTFKVRPAYAFYLDVAEFTRLGWLINLDHFDFDFDQY